MKKSILAISLACAFCAPAFAQSNVAIYGVGDVSFESASSTGSGTPAGELGSRSRIVSNSSYLGFKGSEDLGSGLKAIFQIETGITMDGAQTFSNTGARDTFVGIDGSFGKVTMGYQSQPYRTTVNSFDVVPGATGVGAISGIIGNTGRASAANNLDLVVRSQSILYTSPVFNGFSGSVAYTSNEGKANQAGTANPYGYSLSARYDNGPLALAYAHTASYDALLGDTPANNAAVDGKATGNFLGASYAVLPTTKVGAVWERIRDNANVTNERRDAWGLNVRHEMGSEEFGAAYYRAGSRDTSAGNVAGSKADQFVLRYGHNFSKRTQAYVVYSRIDNDSAAGYNFGVNAVNSLGGATTLGNDPRSIGAGLRHSF